MHSKVFRKEQTSRGPLTLTRQVLILVPVRGGALRIVQTLIGLLETKGKKIVVSNKKRFKEEFGEAPHDKTSNMQRPDDYKAVFSGNVDDYFRIGIRSDGNIHIWGAALVRLFCFLSAASCFFSRQASPS